MNLDALYIELAENKVIAIALLADKVLPADAFAQKYAALIQEHCQAHGEVCDAATAYREAAHLHTYLTGDEPVAGNTEMSHSSA